MMNKAIIDKVRDLVEPVLRDFNVELVDIAFLQERGRPIVRITIDKEGGVTLDDCTRVNREVGYLLEIKDVFPRSYNLEVSSPGLERPLKALKDFEKFLGRKVSIKTSELLNGKRNFKGVLKLIQQETLLLDIEGRDWEIPVSAILQAKLVYEFPGKG